MLSKTISNHSRRLRWTRFAARWNFMKVKHYLLTVDRRSNCAHKFKNVKSKRHQSLNTLPRIIKSCEDFDRSCIDPINGNQNDTTYQQLHEHFL